MKAVNGKTGLVAKTEGAVKDGKWEDAQKLSKQLAEAGAALAKNDVPKGDAKSWEKLTKLYADQTTAIDKAATDKDAKALEKAVKAFKGGCKTCHDAHK
jgi:cytochrome c556